MSTKSTGEEQSEETVSGARSADARVEESQESGSVQGVDHAPPRPSQVVGTATTVLGAFVTVVFTPLAVPFGIAGAGVFAAGLLVTYSTRWLTIGTAMILTGSLISGAYGALTPEVMILAVGAVFVGWDAGQHGIAVGEQLGRRARTDRNQLVHISATTLVTALVGALSYLVSLFGRGGRPGPAVATVVVGVLVLTWLYRL